MLYEKLSDHETLDLNSVVYIHYRQGVIFKKPPFWVRWIPMVMIGEDIPARIQILLDNKERLMYYYETNEEANTAYNDVVANWKKIAGPL